MKKPSFLEEKKIWKKGCEFVIGIDEVGRGSFAGPVVAGAVVFRKGSSFKDGLLSQINDSKLLSSRKREELASVIKKEAIFYAVSVVGISEINKQGVGKANRMAIRKVVKSIMYKVLSSKYKNEKIHNTSYIVYSTKFFILVDGFNIKHIRNIGLKNQKAIIKGDRKSISIAAASIIAKVYRDKLMKNLNQKYPNYDFKTNKGYGTKLHQLALKKYGLSEIHRTSFNLQKFLIS